MQTQKPKQKTPKRPKKITPSYLHNYALYYLERYSSSRKNLERLLTKRIRKSIEFHEAPSFSEAKAMLELELDKLVRLGLLNDYEYTRQKLYSGRRRGKSKRLLTQELRAKGVDSQVIETAFSAMHQDTNLDVKRDELNAAISYCRRRKLGNFRTKPLPEIEQRQQAQKDMAALARRGFSFKIAQQALTGQDEDPPINNPEKPCG